jgi:hypothetical protein
MTADPAASVCATKRVMDGDAVMGGTALLTATVTISHRIAACTHDAFGRDDPSSH